MGRLGPWTLIFYPFTKLGAKMLIDAEIKAENRNPRWRPSAILELLYRHKGPPTKSFHWATSACQILCKIYPMHIFEDGDLDFFADLA